MSLLLREMTCSVLQGTVRLNPFSSAQDAALDASPQKRQLLHGVLAISTAQSLPDRLSSGLLGSESCDASGKRTVEVETDQKFVDDGYRYSCYSSHQIGTWLLRAMQPCVL